jgi:hypothetical protein
MNFEYKPMVFERSSAVNAEQETPDRDCGAGRGGCGLRLGQNYPNPFARSTRLRFELAAAGTATLSVIDLLGRTVSVPIKQYLTAGHHDVTIDVALSPGVYFIRLEANGWSSSRRIVVAR